MGQIDLERLKVDEVVCIMWEWCTSQMPLCQVDKFNTTKPVCKNRITLLNYCDI